MQDILVSAFYVGANTVLNILVMSCVLHKACSLAISVFCEGVGHHRYRHIWKWGLGFDMFLSDGRRDHV